MLPAQVFSGLGIGLLLGVLLGLAASPVVGLVVGAAAALIAPFAGVAGAAKDAADPAAPHTGHAGSRRAAAWRAGAFGLACVFGILGGIWLRAHDALSPPTPSLRAQFDELVGIGIEPAEARKIVVTRTLAAASVESIPAAAMPARKDGVPGVHNTLLFAADSKDCERLAVDRFKDVDAAIDAYRAMDQQALVKVATTIRRRVPDESARAEVLRSVVDAMCAPQ